MEPEIVYEMLRNQKNICIVLRDDMKKEWVFFLAIPHNDAVGN